MSSSEDNDRESRPLIESSTREYLVDAVYEQDLVQALKELRTNPGTPEAAGKHGLLRIPVTSVPPDGKLAELLLRSNPAALGHYGRNRHCAIGTLSTDPKVWGRTPTASVSAPKFWGLLAPAQSADDSEPKLEGSPARALSAEDSDPKVWGGQPPRALTAASPDSTISGRPTLAEGGHTVFPEATPPVLTRSSEDAGLGVVVGVLDAKISNHDYLTGGFLASPDALEYLPSGKTLSNGSGHATFVAGLILQQAPAATVHVKQVLNDEGICDSITLHDAIIDLAQQPIDILNLSLGCTTADNRAPFAVRRALERFRAARPHAIVLAAAGNHPNGHRFWPAALPGVLAVTCASRSTDNGWDETAEFPSGPWVDIAAPGTDVLSTFLTGTYPGPGERPEQSYDGWAVGSGTSFACAIAAGCLARIWIPGCRIGDLLATARHAGAPVTRSGGRLVLGAGQPVH